MLTNVKLNKNLFSYCTCCVSSLVVLKIVDLKFVYFIFQTKQCRILISAVYRVIRQYYSFFLFLFLFRNHSILDIYLYKNVYHIFTIGLPFPSSNVHLKLIFKALIIEQHCHCYTVTNPKINLFFFIIKRDNVLMLKFTCSKCKFKLFKITLCGNIVLSTQPELLKRMFQDQYKLQQAHLTAFAA